MESFFAATGNTCNANREAAGGHDPRIVVALATTAWSSSTPGSWARRDRLQSVTGRTAHPTAGTACVRFNPLIAALLDRTAPGELTVTGLAKACPTPGGGGGRTWDSSAVAMYSARDPDTQRHTNLRLIVLGGLSSRCQLRVIIRQLYSVRALLRSKQR